jgi:hypothetical protein
VGHAAGRGITRLHGAKRRKLGTPAERSSDFTPKRRSATVGRSRETLLRRDALKGVLIVGKSLRKHRLLSREQAQISLRTLACGSRTVSEAFILALYVLFLPRSASMLADSEAE